MHPIIPWLISLSLFLVLVESMNTYQYYAMTMIYILAFIHCSAFFYASRLFLSFWLPSSDSMSDRNVGQFLVKKNVNFWTFACISLPLFFFSYYFFSTDLIKHIMSFFYLITKTPLALSQCLDTTCISKAQSLMLERGLVLLSLQCSLVRYFILLLSSINCNPIIQFHNIIEYLC